MLNLFYRNRQLLWLSIILIVVWGLLSYLTLPRLEDPEITPRFASITTVLPGATPQRVEALVTDVIERELQDIEEISIIDSNSSPSISLITLELQDTIEDIESVWTEVRSKLEATTPLLPAGSSDPEFEKGILKGSALIVGITWKLPTEPNYTILGRLSEDLESRLRYLPGTEEVERFGAPQEEILVTVDPVALSNLGLSVADLSRQLQASDAKVSAGLLRGIRDQILIEVNTQLDSIERIRQTPIQTGIQGQVATVSDIAQVAKQIREPLESQTFIRGQPGVVIAVTVESHTQVDRWARSARQVLDNLEAELSDGLELVVIQDQSEYVSNRLEGVFTNLLISSAFVFAVTIFLMGWRASLIIGLALPFVTLMVFTFMKWVGVPLHQISITGLIISMGLVIDNAIIAVDEVNQQLRRGNTQAQAVQKTVQHLGIPLFASTLTTVFTFVPIATSPGGTGEFIGTIGVTVILALLASLLLSLTIIPTVGAMVAPYSPVINIVENDEGQMAICQSGIQSGQSGALPHMLAHGFSSRWLTAFFRVTLRYFLRRPVLGILLALVLPIIGFTQFLSLEEQFFPPTNRNQLEVELELQASSTIAQTVTFAEQARQIIIRYPQVADVDWFIGESAPSFYYNVVGFSQNASDYAQGIITLDDTLNLKDTVQLLQHDLETALPEAQVLVRQLGQGPPVAAPIELELFGPNLNQLRELGNQMRTILASTPNVVATRADLTESLPKLSFTIDEVRARQVGLSNEAIARQLDAALEGTIGGSLLEDTEDIPLRVRISDQDRSQLETIESIQLLGETANGRIQVPLDSVAKVSLAPSITTINRRNGERLNTIQAYINAKAIPDTVLAEFIGILESQNFQLPDGYRLEYGGEAGARGDAVLNLVSTVSVIIILMTATLVLSFNSFVLAALIWGIAALSVGLSGFALWLFQSIFGFTAILGMMGLIGLSVNDSIVVLAALRENSLARYGNLAAIEQVVFMSTRHVIATTLTTMIGLAPLILDETGFWPPLAITITGGIGGATLLALYFVPCIYRLYAQVAFPSQKGNAQSLPTTSI